MGEDIEEKFEDELEEVIEEVKEGHDADGEFLMKN